ncbi:MAG: hypothetical protein ACVCEJ_01230 [Candidatus Izemoplasmataceae bacterium]
MSDEKTTRKQMTTFDIESEYQQQIAPFEKKLTRLKKSYETKSLRLHKGFLTKEKKAKSKLNKIDGEVKKAIAKIETTNTNKLAQLKKTDQEIKKSLKLKIEEIKIKANEESIIYKEDIDAIRDELHKELAILHDDYLKNVHVYQEKLDSYQSLSNEKNNLYNQTYKKHINSLDDEFNSVVKFTESLQKTLQKAKKSFIKDIQKYITTTQKDEKEAQDNASKTHQAANKKANSYMSQIENFIDSIKASYVNHYQPMLKSIKEQEILLKDTYQHTIEQLQSDFKFRTNEEETLIEQGSKTHEKNQKRRLTLFEERFELYKLIEETIKDRKLALLSYEQSGLRQILDNEMTNLDKLETFLKNDFKEIYDYSTQIYHLENNVFTKMEVIHQKLHQHLERSTSDMISFVETFNQKILTFEQTLISLIKNHLEELHHKNQEIDRLDRAIDLSEPQKEIALNEFEENLALQEIKNRFQIKILNKEHEIDLINQQLEHDIQVLTLEHDKKRLDNDFEITSTKIKAETKLHLEEAKKKFQRAKEIYHLRENSLKHDEKQSLLTLEHSISKIEVEKEKAPFEAEKSQLLLRKEISQSMDQLLQKRDLEAHMIEQKYHEQMKTLDQKIKQIDKDKEDVKMRFIKRKQALVNSFNEQIKAVKAAHQIQLDKLQEAFERECKVPESNIQKWQGYQQKKGQNLQQILTNFTDQFNEQLSNYANIDELETLFNIYDSEEFITNTTNTIFGLYDVYLNTVDTLFTITKETLEDQVSLSIDTSAQRRLTKDLEKRIKDFDKQITTIKKARDQQVKSYVVSLNESLRKIDKQKFQSTSSFIDALSAIHAETNTSLSHLMKELAKEINELFKPMTEQDNMIIKEAKENQAQAKSKLDQELQNKLRPINATHEQALSELSNEEKEEYLALDDQIQELQDKKEYLDKTEKNEVDALTKEYEEKIAPSIEHLTALDEQREKGEVKKLEELDQSLNKLKTEEKEIKQTFEEKLLEAKRILDFEEKIEQTTIENLKAKEQDQLNRKQAIIDEEIMTINEAIKQAEIDLEIHNEELKDKLYKATTTLGHENHLANPEIQKEMQELRSTFENKETSNRDELLENKKMVRHIIESFDQEIRVEYNQFFDQLNQHIEKMKKSYSKNINQEINVFQSLHQALFDLLQSSYEETIKSMKSNTLELNQQLHRLNKNLS